MERHHAYSALTIISFGVLAFNSGLAIYSSWDDDPASVACFVLLADAVLVLLFLCLLRLERASRAGGRSRGSLKAAVWALTTLLTAMFAARVAPLMPPAVAAVVWVMAAATTAAGFWALFMN